MLGTDLHDGTQHLATLVTLWSTTHSQACNSENKVLMQQPEAATGSEISFTNTRIKVLLFRVICVLWISTTPYFVMHCESRSLWYQKGYHLYQQAVTAKENTLHQKVLPWSLAVGCRRKHCHYCLFDIVSLCSLPLKVPFWYTRVVWKMLPRRWIWLSPIQIDVDIMIDR